MPEVGAQDLPVVSRLARLLIRLHKPSEARALCDRARDLLADMPAQSPLAARIAAIRLRADLSTEDPTSPREFRLDVLGRLRALNRAGRRASPEVSCEYYLARGREFISSETYSRSTGMHRRALRWSIRSGQRDLLIAALNNAAVAHRGVGDLFSAEKHLLRAIRVRLSLGDARGAAGQAHNLARVYQSFGRTRDAASLLHRAITLSGRHGQFAAQSLH